MADPTQPPAPQPEPGQDRALPVPVPGVSDAALARGHQPPDERLRVPVGVLGTWVALVLLGALGARILQRLLLPLPAGHRPAHSVEASGRSGLVPAGELAPPPPPRDGRVPALQLRPSQDLKALQQRQTERLSGYGWVDREHGVARIPIARAVELLLQRGLPVREQPAGERSAGEEPARKASGDAAPTGGGR